MGEPTITDGRSKLHERTPDPLLAPSQIDCWKLGLGKIARSRAEVAQQRYFFPEPMLFFGTETVERGVLYLQHWLQARESWLWRARQSSWKALRLPTQRWRDILRLGLGGGVMRKMGDSEWARISAGLKDVGLNLRRDGLMDVTGVDTLSATPFEGHVVEPPVEWRGIRVDWDKHHFIRSGMVREVIWELTELNFRFELLELDAVATSYDNLSAEEQVDRRMMVHKCFFGGTRADFNLATINLDEARYGLTAPEICDRLPFLRALYLLASTWGPHDPAIGGFLNEPPLSIAALLKLEQMLISLYCQVFHDRFSRPPIVPHRL